MNTKLVQKIKDLPKTPGVYIFREQNHRVIYVGKAVSLKNRVPSYFQKTDHDAKTGELVKHIVDLEWLSVGSEFEALILEADLIKRYKPKYNVRLRDDKNYSYLKITKEDYPRVSIVHQITDHDAEYIGPFIERTALRTILKLARHIYPYCTCSLPKDEVCLYYHLKLCPGHGEKYLSKADYQKNINGLKRLFEGKTAKIEKDLKKEMRQASENQQYELAAEYRDKLRFLSRISTARLFSDRELSEDAGLRVLAEALSLKEIPKRIECYDISNIMGVSATGSMVVAQNGILIPRDYRRFQIKTVKGANDYASLSEVIRRRFDLGKTKKKDPSFSQIPDLVIIDGGKGQLSSVLKVVSLPESVQFVALAKKRETIIKRSENRFIETRLPKDSEAMFLIQRIRDEAHRFAITYHRKLKNKELFETSLDGVPGVGPKTKKKLISHFGTVKKIKEATLKELESVVSISLARRIKEAL